MKLKIIFGNILIFFILSQNIVAKESSFLSQADKQKHIAVSIAISGAVTAFARNQGFSKAESFFYGAVSAIALGLVKEGIDGHTEGSTRSWGDVGADAIGATVGSLISAQFEWKF